MKLTCSACGAVAMVVWGETVTTCACGVAIVASMHAAAQSVGRMTVAPTEAAS